VTEKLLAQHLESPSGTGRVEPRSLHTAPPPPTSAGWSLWTNPFSLGTMRRVDGFVDSVNPTISELRRWARSGALEPMQDWDLIVSDHEPGADIIDLIDEGWQARYFLRCLYIRAGDLVRTHKAGELMPLIETARDHRHPSIQTWGRRAGALVMQPTTFDYMAWCGGGLASTPDGS
jgi:hypothetical protein